MAPKRLKSENIVIRDMQEKDIAQSLKIIGKTLTKFELERAKVDLPELFEPRSKLRVPISKCKTTKLKDARYSFTKTKVAIKNKVVVGLCGIYRLDTHPDHLIGIDWFAVDPKYQGQGLGRKFMKWVMHTAAKRKDRLLFVWEVKSAETFYNKFGLKRTRMKLYPRETDILLIKKI